jgi:HAD superfamily hydrolase (TIGR01509 family)
MSTKPGPHWPFDSVVPRAVFFDLDDTLIDTAGQVVEPALQEAADAMLRAGLRVDRDELIDFLLSKARAAKGGNYFAVAVERFSQGCAGSSSPSVAEEARAAFFAADVPDLELLPGCTRLLRHLHDRGCGLFLITAGNPETQRKKIDRLSFAETFDAIAYVNSLEGETKLPAFQQILDRFAFDPSDCLCVGDRVVGEIRDANSLGMWTVRIRGGEFAAVEPSQANEVPDVTVADLGELATLLGIEDLKLALVEP